MRLGKCHTVDAQWKMPTVYRVRWTVVADGLLRPGFRHWRSNKVNTPPDLTDHRSRTYKGLSVHENTGSDKEYHVLSCLTEPGELTFYSLYPLQELGLWISRSACENGACGIETSRLHYESLAQSQMVSACFEVCQEMSMSPSTARNDRSV